MRVCLCAVLQEAYGVAAAVSLHLDALVWDLHVGQLQATIDVRLKWLGSTLKSISGWPERRSYLGPEAAERHVGVAHRYNVSQLFVEGTHFSGSLGLLWLRVRLVPRHLEPPK